MHASANRLMIFGCGYVGTEVARQAIGAGMQVTALTRNQATAAALQALGVQAIVADLASDAWHASIAGGADYVLNAVSSGGGGVEGYRHSYVDGMQSVLRWARSAGPVGTIVYTSSTSVYPQGGGATIDETTPTGGSVERAQLLVAAENLLRAGGARTPNTPPVSDRAAEVRLEPACRRTFILRLAGIYGPGRHQLLEQVRAGQVSGQGEHRLNLIHRDDVCAAIWVAFRAPAAIRDEIFNVADDAPTPKSDVVAWLASRLNVPAPVFSGAPAGTRRAVTPDRIISNAKLKRVLGWSARFGSFREGYENILSRGAE